MAGDEIVDSTGERQQRLRHVALRLAVPALGVGFVITAILLITLHSYRANRAGALSLSNEVLATLQAYVAQEVEAYLEPATRSAAISRDILAHTDAAARPEAFTSYASSVLRQVAQVEAFYLANTKGEFALIRRAPDGGTVTGDLRTDPAGGPTGQVIDRDARGHTTATRTIDTLHDGPATEQIDRFDPRKRRWFTGAIASGGGVFWSHPYLFAPTDKPVITASFATADPDGVSHVTAVDVALDTLSRFIATVKVGRTGRAVIVDRDGHLIAAPELAVTGSKAARDPSHTRLDPDRDPVVTRAYDHFRVDGYGTRIAVVAHANWVTIAAPLPGASPDWVLLIVAPESDFAGFAVADGRQSLLFSLVIVVLALVLAGLLMRQGRRSDRLATLLSAQREVGRDESGALASLAAEPTLLDPASEAPALTETLAAFAGARRVGIWRLVRDGRVLHCDDQYDRTEDGHTGGFELSDMELPRFFEAMRTGETIDVTDAGRDGRTGEFHRLVMQREGTRALSLVPLPGRDAVAGVLVLEDARLIGRARNLARMIASMAAIRLHVADREDEAEAADAMLADAPPELAEAASTTAVLARANLEHDSGERANLEHGTGGDADDPPADAPAGMFPAVAVMLLAFADPASLSRRDGEQLAALAAEIATAMQDIAHANGLGYLKLVSHQLIGATGLSATPDPTAPGRLAKAALEMREMCLTAMARFELEPLFRIGIDVGPADGRMLGRAPALFNLWGDAVRMAELMAATAPEAGTIQATESAYVALRARFLFRPRGAFYMPRTGVARCFLLAGRR